jgi:hypothetical protein
MVSPILPMAGTMDQQQFTQQVIWMGEWTRSPEWAASRVNSPSSILWLILEGNKQVREYLHYKGYWLYEMDENDCVFDENDYHGAGAK